MKNLKSVLFFILVLLYSCADNDKEYSNIQLTHEEVIETFTDNLPENVKRIETITSEHPLYKNVLEQTDYFANLKTSSTINAIYYFNNESLSVLSQSGNIVWATIQENNGNIMEKLIADFSGLESNGIVTIEYLVSGVVEVVNLNSLEKGWGSCMKNAIKMLYDDWEDDPVGTLTCWVTGPLCVIGGGIACGIQQL